MTHNALYFSQQLPNQYKIKIFSLAIKKTEINANPLQAYRLSHCAATVRVKSCYASGKDDKHTHPKQATTESNAKQPLYTSSKESPRLETSNRYCYTCICVWSFCENKSIFRTFQVSFFLYCNCVTFIQLSIDCSRWSIFPAQYIRAAFSTFHCLPLFSFSKEYYSVGFDPILSKIGISASGFYWFHFSGQLS